MKYHITKYMYKHTDVAIKFWGSFFVCVKYNLSPVVRKPAFCLCENKGADQLHSNCAADQRLCFRYSDSTLPLLPKFEISSI